MPEKRKLKYHHLGIPTTEVRDNEIYLPHLKLSCVPGTSNAYGIEWTRFDEDADYPGILKQYAHVAFEVDSLAKAIEGERVVVPPAEIVNGTKVAYIDVLGAPVKLMEIDRASAGDIAINPVEASCKPVTYHHTGIPCNKTFENEIRVPHLKLAYLPGSYNKYGVEWMRFDEDNENPDIIKHLPHVAFEVDDIEQAIDSEHVLYHSGGITPGIIVAMIEVAGAAVELIELDRAVAGNRYDS